MFRILQRDFENTRSSRHRKNERTKGRSKTLLEKGELNIDFGFLIKDEDEEMNETQWTAAVRN